MTGDCELHKLHRVCKGQQPVGKCFDAGGRLARRKAVAGRSGASTRKPAVAKCRCDVAPGIAIIGCARTRIGAAIERPAQATLQVAPRISRFS